MHCETESVYDAPEEASYEVYHICVLKSIDNNIIQVNSRVMDIFSSLGKTNKWLINFVNFLNEVKVWLNVSFIFMTQRGHFQKMQQ